MTLGSLFSGIGGFDLGFAWAGFAIRWQVENHPYAIRILSQHWPDVRRYRDVRTCRDLESVDVVCGGFPCQPYSAIGRHAADRDVRALWGEFVRIIRDTRPRPAWIVAENVPGLLAANAGREFGGVLRDLASLGFDAEWDCLRACDVGAPHLRDRVWLVATRHTEHVGSIFSANLLADAIGPGLEGHTWYAAARDESRRLDSQTRGSTRPRSVWRGGPGGPFVPWHVEPDVGRMAHGIPARVDRIKALGNAIVPQIAYAIARRIHTLDEVTHAL